MDDEDIVPLSRVQRAFSFVSFKVKDKISALKFIKSKDLYKDASNRFLSWLVVLEAIPADNSMWPETFYHIIRNYRNKLSYYISKSKQEVPYCLDKKTTDLIIADVNRGITLFYLLIKEIGVPESMADDAKIRIARVICLMLREAPQFNYIQGYDRFASISFALALHFALRIQLSLIEAESFAIVLLRRIVAFSEPARFLTNHTSAVNYYVELDAFLKEKNPQFMRILLKSKLNSEHFASGWIGVLFADNHSPNGTLLIWDRVILNRAKIGQFIKALVSAHVEQIELTDEPMVLLQRIFEKKDWDDERLLDDAEYLIKSQILTKELIGDVLSFWL